MYNALTMNWLEIIQLDNGILYITTLSLKDTFWSI